MAPAPPVILYEDESLLAVDKPAGIHTAPIRVGETGTLLDMVIAAFPEVARVPGMKPIEPGLLHRLDRDTSGIVVVARTAAAYRALRGQFVEDDARKEYRAACARTGGKSDKKLWIESRFAPYGPGRKRVRVVLPDEKREQLLRKATKESYRTEAEVISLAPDIVLLRVRIVRGFRHQVRAHLSFLGYPILGDLLYGVPVPPGLHERMYLHASHLALVHPLTGAPLVVDSPLPEEFRALFPEAR